MARERKLTAQETANLKGAGCRQRNAPAFLAGVNESKFVLGACNRRQKFLETSTIM
jgi:hypothetical protein